MKEKVFSLYYQLIKKPLSLVLKNKYGKLTETAIHDAVDETFYQFWKDLKKRPNPPMRSTLFHYLVTIGKRQCYRESRKASNTKKEEKSNLDPEFEEMLQSLKPSTPRQIGGVLINGISLEEVIKMFPNIEKYGFKNTLELCELMISKLDENYCKYITDRYFLEEENLAHYSTLAKKWSLEEDKNVTEGTARKRVHDVKEKLRSLLKEL